MDWFRHTKRLDNVCAMIRTVENYARFVRLIMTRSMLFGLRECFMSVLGLQHILNSKLKLWSACYTLFS